MIPRPVALLWCVLASLTIASCGGDGATNPDPNADRLEIAFGYAAPGGPGFLFAAMDLYQMTKDGRLTTPFIATPYIEQHPQWSNDGKKIVFTNTGSDGSSIWVANADLTGIRQVLVSANDQDYGSWSPRGDSIAFNGMISSTEYGVLVMDAAGAGVRLAAQGGSWPSWSVNGRIAFSRDGEIWTVSPDGSGLLRVTSVATGEYDELAQWSRDGSRLAFIHVVPANNSYGRDFDVVTIRADGTDRRTLVAHSMNESPSWSPDGKYILYGQQDTSDPDPNRTRCTLFRIPADGGASVNLTPDRGIGLCGGASWRPM
jgi:Tol biopolymer transport system component